MSFLKKGFERLCVFFHFLDLLAGVLSSLVINSHKTKEQRQLFKQGLYTAKWMECRFDDLPRSHVMAITTKMLPTQVTKWSLFDYSICSMRGQWQGWCNDWWPVMKSLKIYCWRWWRSGGTWQAWMVRDWGGDTWRWWSVRLMSILQLRKWRDILSVERSRNRMTKHGRRYIHFGIDDRPQLFPTVVHQRRDCSTWIRE